MIRSVEGASNAIYFQDAAEGRIEKEREREIIFVMLSFRAERKRVREGLELIIRCIIQQQTKFGM